MAPDWLDARQALLELWGQPPRSLTVTVIVHLASTSAQFLPLRGAFYLLSLIAVFFWFCSYISRDRPSSS